MHHKSIVLRMALPGSLWIQSDPTTVFRNWKTFELQGVGRLGRDCSVFRELSAGIKFHHISFFFFSWFCKKKKKKSILSKNLAKWSHFMLYCPLHWDIITVSKIGQWQRITPRRGFVPANTMTFTLLTPFLTITWLSLYSRHWRRTKITSQPATRI